MATASGHRMAISARPTRVRMRQSVRCATQQALWLDAGGPHMTAPHSHEITLPTQRWGALLCLSLLVAAAACSVFALSNLASGIAPCASLFWLILVVCWLVGAALLARQQGGVLQVLLEFAADACCHRAVAWVPTEDERPFLQLVVRIAGWRCVVRRIEIAKIHSVRWSAGQASGRAKRDMNDWGVCIWFLPGAMHPTNPTRRRRAELDLVYLGTSGGREQAAALGQSSVDLLREAGLDLAARSDANCFVRSSAGPAQTPPSQPGLAERGSPRGPGDRRVRRAVALAAAINGLALVLEVGTLDRGVGFLQLAIASCVYWLLTIVYLRVRRWPSAAELLAMVLVPVFLLVAFQVR